MADKFVLLLDFSSGIIEPLPLSTEALTDDRIVIAIDELKERVWLWQGSSTTLVERRAAQRKARSLVSAGYQLGPYRIGRDVTNIEIIDGEILDDPEIKGYYDQLIHTLSQKFNITEGVLGRFGGTPSPAPPPTKPAPQPAPVEKVTAPTPAVTEAAPAKPTTETVAPKPSRELQGLGIIRVGILISSILDFFPMCYVSVTKMDEGTRYSIEDPEGIICQVEVSQNSVHFLQRYDFRGRRNDILGLLRDRLAAADL
ncbi:MAG: hypothetical protein ACXACH_06080 [Candidatus Hermodarchaeia archaeon]|jgi:hypothetical protein